MSISLRRSNIANTSRQFTLFCREKFIKEAIRETHPHKSKQHSPVGIPPTPIPSRARPRPRRRLVDLACPPASHGCRRLRRGPPPRVRQGQRPPRQALPQARPQGVHQGGGADGDRVRRHGVRRLLRQAHLHPHQQHHRRLRLGWRTT